MNDCPLLIGCPGGITTRMEFIFQTLLYEMSGISVTLTVDMDAFDEASTPKLLYGKPLHTGTPYLLPAGFLSKTGISEAIPDLNWHEGNPVIFFNGDLSALLPFDVFSAAFWIVSRYEEYLPFQPDLHGRFPAEASLAGKHGLLAVPLADLWASMLVEKLRALYPKLSVNPRNYQFIPTIDADSAWAYRHKSPVRQMGAALRELVTGRWKDLVFRIAALTGFRPDPFDTWDLIEKLHRESPPPIVFFLLGKYGTFNKNTHPSSKALRKLILRYAKQNLAGIHPSYQSSVNKDVIKFEIDILQAITKQKVIRSRQHFLRFRLPDTYRNLIQCGIQEDYSMGYAATPGFRAGTCKPFRFYDLEREEVTSLLIFPVTVMDGTLRDYLHLKPTEAVVTIEELITVVKKYQGVFVSLWHNESLSEHGRWKGWRKVYENLLLFAQNNR